MTERPYKTYSVLIASGSERAGGRLADLLPGNRFAPVTTMGSGGEARRALLDAPYDILLINGPLPDEFGPELALYAAADARRGVLLLVPGDMYEETADSMEPSGVLTLGKPISAQLLVQAMRLLTTSGRRLSALEEKNTTLAAKMEEIRLVNRAKWLLIGQLSMDEAAAHRYIEKQAIDARRSRAEIARSILSTYENR